MANNPMFNEAAFERAQESARAVQPMTLQGTINKTFCLLFLCVVGAMFTWTNPQISGLAMGLSAIGAFVLAMVTFFKPSISAFTAPIYALLEGVSCWEQFPPNTMPNLKALCLMPWRLHFLCFLRCFLSTAQKLLKYQEG